MKRIVYFCLSVITAAVIFMTGYFVKPELSAAGETTIRCQQVKMVGVKSYNEFTKKEEAVRDAAIINRCVASESICYYIRNGHQLSCIKR